MVTIVPEMRSSLVGHTHPLEFGDGVTHEIFGAGGFGCALLRTIDNARRTRGTRRGPTALANDRFGAIDGNGGFGCLARTAAFAVFSGCGFNDGHKMPLPHKTNQKSAVRREERISGRLKFVESTNKVGELFKCWASTILTSDFHLLTSDEKFCDDTDGRDRTRDTRFWRPMLYQLSYVRKLKLPFNFHFSFTFTNHAQAVGLEPTTFGFGDQHSTN